MKVLCIIALICVPLMLFVKPIYENNKNKHDIKVHHGEHHQINEPFIEPYAINETERGSTMHAHHPEETKNKN